MFSLPRSKAWPEIAALSAAFMVIAAAFGLATGLYTFELASDLGSLSRRIAITFIAPGLMEELVFRGPLIWLATKRGKAPIWAIAISLAAFIAWHPLNAMFYLTEAQNLFYNWRFLTVAAALGAVATILALRTRSIWPPVLFHWIAVYGWMAWLGAPDFF